MSSADYISAPSVAILGRGAFSEVSLKRVVASTPLPHPTSSSTTSVAPNATRTLVAVKHIVRQDAILNGRVGRIMAEKKSLELLKSVDLLGTPSYCIKLLDTYKNEMTLGFVYEPVFGGSLSQHISLATRLDDSTARIYAAEVIAALHHLGCVGVLHRDLKSKNILLNSQGHIRICDFGSAKVLDPIFEDHLHLSAESDGVKEGDSGSKSSYDFRTSLAKNSLRKKVSKSYAAMPRVSTFIGTEYAMAPELKLLARKNKLKGAFSGYSYPVDYWSLGILIVEMIIGNAVLDPDIEQVAHFAEVNRIAGPNALSLVSSLLDPDPEKRLIAADLTTISVHPFFDGIDWVRILEGTHRCGDINFDRRIGYMEVEERYSGVGAGDCSAEPSESSSKEKDVDITAEQQLLFDGY